MASATLANDLPIIECVRESWMHCNVGALEKCRHKFEQQRRREMQAKAVSVQEGLMRIARWILLGIAVMEVLALIVPGS